MEQAKYPPCPSCQTPIAAGHKFCGRCGTTTPSEYTVVTTEYFGELQDPTKASLVVIRGEGLEGLSYHLRASEHVIGTRGQIELDDPFVSQRHANLFYRGSQLVLRDEHSLNGTFLRVRGKTKLALGDAFLAGDQLFRIDANPPVTDEADDTGTYFYASPVWASSFRLVQVLEGGETGLVHCPRTTRVTIGRQGNDLNVPDDPHLSQEHCVLEQDADGFSLVDLDSKNGTYAVIRAERVLDHSDYFMVGRKLLRVEFNA